MQKLEIWKPTENQEQLVCSVCENPVTIVTGPAGTGKTSWAIKAAVSQLESRRIDRIIFSRNIMNVGRQLGSFPGDCAEKCSPYFTYAESYFKKFIQGKVSYGKHLQEKNIEWIN